MPVETAFVSGNEAVALGVRLARPHVISASPITPQTTVVERLSEMVEDGSLKAEFIYVESEHSALSACMGASSIGARTFTATSAQGLLYMAECLHYASGGRFAICMMNANRSLALPWSIYGDQRDSLSLLDCGWIQVYVEDAQESLDMVLQSYAIAENGRVLTPVMENLDGFALTHTYETVEVPTIEQADAFLPPFETPYKLDLDNPKNMAFSTGPADNMEFKYQQHKVNKAKSVDGTSYIHVFAPCPTGWGTSSDSAIDIGKEVVDCGLWYLAEWEDGEFILNRNPKEFASVRDYLSNQGRFRHLLDGDVGQIIQERDRKWAAIRKNWRIEARELRER
jgi:pyruvate/2-oxoacid:ferredoxin oxidoreductase alpha subunit